VRLRLKESADTSFLVWTTTPWTLISNVALAVAPEVDYVKVRHESEYLILAEARLSVLGGTPEVVERYKGKDLAGKEYHRMFSYHPVSEKAFYVVEANFVTTEDGTGIVHIAPAYGEDDYQLSRAKDLPTIHPVNRSGEFGPDVPDFAGKFVKDADADIIRMLKERGILLKKETITHSYPHCWRCDTPLLRRSARDGSATGSKRTRTGRFRATVSGARPCRSGSALTAEHRNAWGAWRSCGKVRTSPSRWTCTNRPSTR
jgi:isoleucyl-tRNA synthetase